MSSGIVDRVQARAQEVAKEDYAQAKELMSDAARSRAYMYPIKGILYFTTHRALWKPFLSRMATTVSLSIGVVTSMFFLTYLPQLGILVFFNGPLAVFTTVLLVLNESSVIVSIISRNFLLQEALLDTFDGTLIERGETAVVKGGREVSSSGGKDAIERLGKILKNPFDRFSIKGLVRYVMYLPLNFIPVAGTIIFIILQGRIRGRSVHDRYFQLKAWSKSRKSDWLDRHSGAYSSFGVVATLLEMIPFASIPLAFTNAVGAALWAADIESKSTMMEQTTAPELREAANKVD